MPSPRRIFWDGQHWRRVENIKAITPGAVYEPMGDIPVVEPASGDVVCFHISKPGWSHALCDLALGKWIEPGYSREIV